MSRPSRPPPGRADIQRRTSPSAQVASKPDRESRNRSTGAQMETILAPGRGQGADNKHDPGPKTMAGKLIMLWPPPLPVKASLRSPLRAGAKATNIGCQAVVFLWAGCYPEGGVPTRPRPSGAKGGWKVGGSWVAGASRQEKEKAWLIGDRLLGFSGICLFRLGPSVLEVFNE